MAGRKKKAKPANVKTSTMPETITIESTSAGEVSRCEDVTPPTQEKLEEQDKDVACSDSSDDFQSSASNVKQQNKRLLSEIKTLQEKVAMLENERDFLRTTLTTAMASTGKSQPKKKQDEISSGSSDSEIGSSSSCAILSSASSDDEPKKKKKRKTKKEDHPLAKTRAQTPDDVLQRYINVLKAYKSCRSMTKAFQKTRIDRNTMALSAPLAEIMLIKPKFLKTLPAFDMGKEKLMEH
ncbi:coiled-coil domain-containing protein 106-like [Alosa sapidissima]|uniref:coiled-coil domain-containing protein 106-like n=1 Tax=Alosa sapidissima TaxID=34773 RepID=UPI001C09E1A3|nr:coiled-coil domain-containing protein 106-like [Alosa sapidissima]